MHGGWKAASTLAHSMQSYIAHGCEKFAQGSIHGSDLAGSEPHIYDITGRASDSGLAYTLVHCPTLYQ